MTSSLSPSISSYQAPTMQRAQSKPEFGAQFSPKIPSKGVLGSENLPTIAFAGVALGLGYFLYHTMSGISTDLTKMLGMVKTFQEENLKKQARQSIWNYINTGGWITGAAAGGWGIYKHLKVEPRLNILEGYAQANNLWHQWAAEPGKVWDTAREAWSDARRQVGLIK